MNDLSPNPGYEVIEATNPCGEQPLPPYDSCNLGSINLGTWSLMSLPRDYNRQTVDPARRRRLGTPQRDSSANCVHFLDNIIDANKYPIPEIEDADQRIAASVLASWVGRICWSNCACHITAMRLSSSASKSMDFINSEGHFHSSELASVRGKFPNWEHSRFEKDGVSMRNATVTTIAPTGTISIIAGCSSGIEPYYAVSLSAMSWTIPSLLMLIPCSREIAQQARLLFVRT